MTHARLTNRTVLVTGGARGIGAAICRGLAAEGAHVTVVDLDEEGARDVAAQIVAEGGNAIGVRADVTDRQQIVAAIAAGVERFGRLDVMFNNAGLNIPMHFLDVTEQNWQTIMDANALGVLMGTQEAARQMITQGVGGKIVNTVSIAGRQGYASFAPYSASKFAVIALIQAGARALAEHSITVNGFSPGVVGTPLWEQLDRDLRDLGDSTNEGDAFASFAGGTLIGRAARPEDLVPTAVFLASSDSDYITGQVIAVDGGMVLV